MKDCEHVPKSFIYRERPLWGAWCEATIVSGECCARCGLTLRVERTAVFEPRPRYMPTVLR